MDSRTPRRGGWTRIRLQGSGPAGGDPLAPADAALERLEGAPDDVPCLLEVAGDTAPAGWADSGPALRTRLLAWGERLAVLFRREGALRVGWADGEVRGPALELLLACDLLLLDRGASLALFPPGEGYFPVGGGLTRALRRSGSARLLPACIEGRPVPAAEAVAMGLASSLADAEERDRILEGLCRSEPRALSGIAALARRGGGLGGRQAEALERAVFSWCFAGGEPAEAIRTYRGVRGGSRTPGGR